MQITNKKLTTKLDCFDVLLLISSQVVPKQISNAQTINNA